MTVDGETAECSNFGKPL